MRLLAPALAALCLSATLAVPAMAQDAPRFAFFSINQLVRSSKKAGAIFSGKPSASMAGPRLA